MLQYDCNLHCDSTLLGCDAMCSSNLLPLSPIFNRNLYKQLQILTSPSLYIFSLLLFVSKYRDLFLSNSEIHDIHTHFNYNLHLPSTDLTLVQKGVFYSGSRIYNHLPTHIKNLSQDFKQFKSKLKAFLLEHTCYRLEEFYQITSKST